MDPKRIAGASGKGRTECVALIVQILVLAAIVVGIWVAFRQLSQNAQDTRYRYLTDVWNDIMKESIRYPDFNDKSKTLVYKTAFDGDRRRQYETYARWVGGFVEDLYINDYEGEGYLYYEPWIETALETHLTWLVDHIDYYRETPRMQERIQGAKAKTQEHRATARETSSPAADGSSDPPFEP